MRHTLVITALIVLTGLAGACAKMLGLEQEKQDWAFEHRAHVINGINCLECHAGIKETGETGPLMNFNWWKCAARAQQ